MTTTVSQSSDQIIRIRISGVMSVADQRAIQAHLAARINAGQALKTLVVLEGFEGWEKNEAWADLGFMIKHGNRIARMAVVGEERWRDDAMLFAGKGFRDTRVEFFPSVSMQEAEAWLVA